MADKLVNNLPFGVSGGKSGVISLVGAITSGTVTLQKLCGNDPDGTWVTVSGGVYSANFESTFWAPPGQQYRVTISGTADVYAAG